MEFVFKIQNALEEPIRGQSFEITLEHPDILSDPSSRVTTNEKGNFSLTVDFRIRRNIAPETYELRLNLKSGVLGSQTFVVMVDPQKNPNPLIGLRKSDSNFKPETLLVHEELVVSIVSLVTLKRIEKSTEVSELTVEHMAMLSTRESGPLKNRRVFYEVSFSDATIPQASGSTTTNESGELSFHFLVPFRPYENESNLQIEVSARLEESPTAQKSNWFLLVNFYRDLIKPLLAFSRTPLELSPESTRATSISIPPESFRLSEIEKLLSFQINDRLELSFVPHFELQAKLELRRFRLDRAETEHKPLPQLKVRGKIFILREALSRPMKILSETVFETNTDVDAELHVDLHPQLEFYPWTSDGNIWLIALEMVNLPKVPKAFFEYDPSKNHLKSISRDNLNALVRNRISDLSSKSAPPPDEKSVVSISKILPNAVELKNLPTSFEDLLKPTEALSTQELSRALLEAFPRKLFGEGPRPAISLRFLDFPQGLESYELLEHRDQPLGMPLAQDYFATLYQFRLKAKTERCFVFAGGGKEFYACRKGPFALDEEQSWIVIRSRSDMNVVMILRDVSGALKTYDDLETAKKAVVPGMILRRILP